MAQINEEALASAKVLDPANPPMKSKPYEAFPKCVFLHPRDKSKSHLAKVVADQDELDAALKAGWKAKPHIPVIEEPLPEGFEPEVAEPEKAKVEKVEKAKVEKA